jgi:hypothetical protein
MASPQGSAPDDQAVYITEIFKAVAAELGERLDVQDLSEKDELAITTAIAKAAWRGFLRGVATQSHGINQTLTARFEQLRRELPPDVVLPDITVETWLVGSDGDIGSEPDAWFERYGDDS